ncbi:MAG: MBL fold metallo-hydrolase [Arcobacteraceae bacterium]
MKFKFLGSADSAGIPVHNCHCIACNEYREQGITNLATCAVLEYNNKVILFDAGIENISNILDGKKILAICLTHFHPDHVLGLLRLRHSKDKINCYHPKDDLGFSDLFKHKKSINYIEHNALNPIIMDGIKITPIPLKHSKNTTGYIIETPSKSIAYLTDCAGIEEKYLKILQTYHFDYVFLDAGLTPPQVGNHLNFESASDLMDRLHVQNGYFMHQGHNTLTYIMKNKTTLKYPYLGIGAEFELPLQNTNKQYKS